jgi:hypothetical protein
MRRRALVWAIGLAQAVAYPASIAGLAWFLLVRA